MKEIFKMELWQFLYVILSVYFTYFEGLRNTRRVCYVSAVAFGTFHLG